MNKVLWHISKWLLLPSSSYQKYKHWIFLQYSLLGLCRAPEGKTHYIMGLSLGLISLGFLTLRLIHTKPGAIFYYSSGFPTTTLVPMEDFALISCNSVSTCLYIQCWANSLFCDLTSPIDIWRVVFSFFRFSFVVEDEVETSKLLIR